MQSTHIFNTSDGRSRRAPPARRARRAARESNEHGGDDDGADRGDFGRASDLDPRRARVLLALILIAAFALRVVYVLQSRASPLFAEPQMDALYHVDWARAFADGRDFQPGPFFRAPLYPWFLGLCFKLLGENLLWPRLIQCGFGTLATALVYLVGARVFDRRVGLLAALFAATYWLLIYFDGELLLPTLEVPLNLLAIWLSLRVHERPNATRSALAGCAWGVAAIVRPNVLLFALPLAAWIGWAAARAAPTTRARFWMPLVFVLALCLPILPISIYNRGVGGDAVLISSQGGVNLWIGNNPHSDGSSALVPGTRADWWGGYYDAIRLAEAEEGRTLRPSEVSQHYTRKVFEFVRAQPVLALRQLLHKLQLFWMDYELGNNQDERFFALRFGPLLRWLPLGFGLTAPLALVGFALCMRRAWRLFPLWGFLPIYTASVVAFFVCARFRVPVLPVLMILAAFTCAWIIDVWRARRWLALCGAGAACALLIAVVERVPATVDTSDSQGLWQLGVFATQHDDLAGAADLFQQAIEARPRNARAHKDLGIVLERQGRFEAAEASLQRALALDPANTSALHALFAMQFQRGQLGRARKTLAELMRTAPVYAPAHYELGRLILAEAARRDNATRPITNEERESALAAFRAALALASDPDDIFNSALGAGGLLWELGRPLEAVEAFERGLRARPQPDAAGWYWESQRGRVRALLAAGKTDDARAAVDRLESAYGDRVEVIALRGLLPPR